MPQFELLKRSFIDDDLYNFSMALAFQLFPDVKVRYKYINRMKGYKFAEGFDRILQEQCEMCEDLRFLPHEEKFFETMPWYPRTFINSLRGTRFDSKAVKISQKDGVLNIAIEGYPYEVCLWECTLLPTITELSYRYPTPKYAEDGWMDKIKQKADKLAAYKVNWADFGTRRRFSSCVHEHVVRIMSDYQPYFRGTSNVHFAEKYKVKAVGTYAHQWEQLMQAIYGPRMAAVMAMKHWQETYHGNLGTALSDTLTTNYFLKVFDSYYANLFQGVRQDSGDPYIFADKIIAHYKNLGINPMTKIIVFSDGLDVDKAIALNKYCEGKILCTFGIGTNLVSDVGHTPMNHVIKMSEVFVNGEWVPVVKLSDDLGKVTGDLEQVYHVMRELRIK
jgi:nicotinate phosphoribosyltransferase